MIVFPQRQKSRQDQKREPFDTLGRAAGGGDDFHPKRVNVTTRKTMLKISEWLLDWLVVIRKFKK